MIEVLQRVLRFCACMSVVVPNTLLHATPLLILAVFKVCLPIPRWRRRLSHWLIVIAQSWIAVNSWVIARMTPARLRIDGELAQLQPQGWYLVLCNHQSWVDILVLQAMFNRRIPFLKFFLKAELIWVPVLGLAWWALDFPFMRRYSKETLRKHPEWRGKDIEATRKACEKFRDLPVSVMNFVEGTRYTAAKHAGQQSPYPNLLQPRAGGVAFVMETMGDMLQAVVDVTLVYSGRRPTLFDLLSGQVKEIHADVRQRTIPADLLGGDYENDSEYRARFQAWINGLWAEKEARIMAMRATSVSSPS